MKAKNAINVAALALRLLALASTISTQPTSASQNDITERTMHRRAVEAVIWGMPAVNYDLMYQAMVREGHGAFNQIAYWSRLPDWEIQTLTPNPDATTEAFFDQTWKPEDIEEIK